MRFAHAIFPRAIFPRSHKTGAQFTVTPLSAASTAPVDGRDMPLLMTGVKLRRAHLLAQCVLSFAFATLANPAFAQGTAARSADANNGLGKPYFQNFNLPTAHFVDTGKRRNNIIWVTVCSLRPDHLGVYGYDKNTTPALDAWAKDALVFANHHANAPWTRPATASMLTGLFPSGHRTQTDRSAVPKEITTLAQVMRDQGYRTAAIVGNGNAGRITNLDRGFDDYADTVNRWKGLPRAKDILGEAEIWLKAHKDDTKPWFLFLFLVDVHNPYHAPKKVEAKWLKGYKGKLVRSPRWEHNPHYSPAQRKATVALYDAAINQLDVELGRFFSTVDGLGLANKSTMIFTADHGEGFGDHGYFLHAHHLLNEFIRVPLIIKSPAWQGQGKVVHLTQGVDLAPTLVGLAGGSARPEWVGRDLSKLLSQPVQRGRIGLSEFNEFGIHRSAIFDLDHKIILQRPADKKAFLQRIPRVTLLPSVLFDQEQLMIFDRQADPRELKPLKLQAPTLTAAQISSLSPRNQAMVQALRAYLEQAPAASDTIDPKTVPKAVVDDLRSLGYVQ